MLVQLHHLKQMHLNPARSAGASCLGSALHADIKLQEETSMTEEKHIALERP